MNAAACLQSEPVETASFSPVQRGLSHQHTLTGMMYEVGSQVLVKVSYVLTKTSSKTVLKNRYNERLNL